MKLYYSPGACSLAPHIVLNEIDVPYTLVEVNLRTKKTQDGSDFHAIHSKGYVPLLELEDGQRLSECGAVLLYLADLAPHRRLATADGTLERYRLQEWLSFIACELHKQFSPLYDETPAEAIKKRQVEELARCLDWTAEQLGRRLCLTGGAFTVADAYLFTVLNWCRDVSINLGAWPQLTAYVANIAARPSVQTTLRKENLLESWAIR